MLNAFFGLKIPAKPRLCTETIRRFAMIQKPVNAKVIVAAPTKRKKSPVGADEAGQQGLSEGLHPRIGKYTAQETSGRSA
jgi:hypothetical protein